MSDFNKKIIDEFRDNHGKVGGPFQSAPMVILHHVGRSTGRTYETPLVYQSGAGGRIFVFASKAGTPENPAWYHNLIAAGTASVEVGDETFDVAVTELTGPERDRVFAQQTRVMPGFAEYEAKTEGIRRIPVLELRRV